jgi:hypothetical protein
MPLVDFDDLKIKHLTGEYQFMPSAPEPEDVIYYCYQKKKKIFTMAELIEFFGEEKTEIIKESIKHLDFENHIRQIEEGKYQIDGRVE